MVAVELFVMFFEVMFLYRELIDALTPWIAQQTGMKVGLTVTLSLSAFGWIGIRGMTWFLFGQYGTPPMLAFISRKPMVDDGHPRPANSAPAPPGGGSRWRSSSRKSNGFTPRVKSSSTT